MRAFKKPLVSLTPGYTRPHLFHIYVNHPERNALRTPPANENKLNRNLRTESLDHLSAFLSFGA